MMRNYDLSEEDQVRAEALRLTGYVWTTRWSRCWNCGKGTHVIKRFAEWSQWVCLGCAVIWRTDPRPEPKKKVAV